MLLSERRRDAIGNPRKPANLPAAIANPAPRARPCPGRRKRPRSGAKRLDACRARRQTHAADGRLRAAPRERVRSSLATSRECHSGEDVVGCKDSQLITFVAGRRDAQPLHGVVIALAAAEASSEVGCGPAAALRAARSQSGMLLDRAAGAIIQRESWSSGSELAVERPALAADTFGGLLQE